MANINIDIAITDKSERNWIYRDINENLELDPVNREISSYYDVAAVNNSLINLFRFSKGERQLNMEYGINLDEFLYEPINQATALAMGNRIKEGISDHEPRVSLTNINIVPNHVNNQYDILITYSVPLLGTDEYEMQYNLNRG